MTPPDPREALDILDVIDGIVDDTHPEGDGCPLCKALDDLRSALASEPSPGLDARLMGYAYTPDSRRFDCHCWPPCESKRP